MVATSPNSLRPSAFPNLASYSLRVVKSNTAFNLAAQYSVFGNQVVDAFRWLLVDRAGYVGQQLFPAHGYDIPAEPALWLGSDGR